jgi:hypothetical protein
LLVDFLREKDLTVEQALIGIDQPFHLTDGGRVHRIAAPMNDSSLSPLFQQVKVERTIESFGVQILVLRIRILMLKNNRRISSEGIEGCC